MGDFGGGHRPRSGEPDLLGGAFERKSAVGRSPANPRKASERLGDGSIMTSDAPLTAKVVLVVDDDVLVRMVLAGFLLSRGVAVLEAGSADEAIALLDGHPEIGFLVTDVEMPGSMDGVRLAHHVRNRWPPVKILVVSGRLHVTLDQLPDTAAFLRKPFADNDLWRELTKLSG